MSWSHEERLYKLLPGVHRMRDHAKKEPLRALLSIIEGEMETLEADIDGLYNNWFIETCDEWVVPYIADLLGNRRLNPILGGKVVSLRAFVANTIRFRRRKGTATVLEQLSKDVTAWPARAVEYFKLLSTSQNLNHVRLFNSVSPDLRDTQNLGRLETPFNTISHSVEVRRIQEEMGKYNIPNVGLHLWRLQGYPIHRSEARSLTSPGDGRFSFDPTGRDIPLFNRPKTEITITHLAEEINVPGELGRRALYQDLKSYRNSLVQGMSPESDYFDDATPVIKIYFDETELSPEEIEICTLEDWGEASWSAPNSKTIARHDDTEFTTRVAVDPELGRLVPLQGETPDRVYSNYSYGFSGDLAGGPYERNDSANLSQDREVTWQIGVTQETALANEEIVNTLSDAIDLWNAQAPGAVGVISILDNLTYEEMLSADQTVLIPESSQLMIIAADWPIRDIPNSGGLTERRPGDLIASGLRPHLLGQVDVRGTAPALSENPGTLILNGIWLEGDLQVLEGNLGHLHISHSSIIDSEIAGDTPRIGKLQVLGTAGDSTDNNRLDVVLDKSVFKTVILSDTITKLSIADCILFSYEIFENEDEVKPKALVARGAECKIDRSSFLGGVETEALSASESIFIDPVYAIKRQEGCIRYSWIAKNSVTPRRYRCQPDLAFKQVQDKQPFLSDEEQNSIRARMCPLFTSTRWGHPGFFQLTKNNVIEVLEGAEDAGEMGVFHFLMNPHRIKNLETILDEYLPFGLEAGIFFVT